MCKSIRKTICEAKRKNRHKFIRNLLFKRNKECAFEKAAEYRDFVERDFLEKYTGWEKELEEKLEEAAKCIKTEEKDCSKRYYYLRQYLIFVMQKADVKKEMVLTVLLPICCVLLSIGAAVIVSCNNGQGWTFLVLICIIMVIFLCVIHRVAVKKINYCKICIELLEQKNREHVQDEEKASDTSPAEQKEEEIEKTCI